MFPVPYQKAAGAEVRNLDGVVALAGAQRYRRDHGLRRERREVGPAAEQQDRDGGANHAKTRTTRTQEAHLIDTLFNDRD